MYQHFFEKTRPFWNGLKNVVEDTNKIDINWLMRSGNHKIGTSSFNSTITWTRSGMWGETKNRINYDIDLVDKDKSTLRLHYISIDRFNDERIKVDYTISLSVTNCNYGGFRHWFSCSGLNCTKRVGCLYLGAKYFLCRYCLDLSYEKRNTSKRFRRYAKIFNYEDKIKKLSEKIWGKNGRIYYNGVPTKSYRQYMKYCSLENDNYNYLKDCL